MELGFHAQVAPEAPLSRVRAVALPGARKPPAL